MQEKMTGNAVITNIGIEKIVVVSKTGQESGNKYELALTWTLNFGRVYDYDGEYKANLYEDHKKTAVSEKIIVSAENKLKGTVSLGPLEAGKKYSVTICTTSSGKEIESSEVAFIPDEIASFQGTYEHGAVNLEWEKPDGFHWYYFCEIQKEDGYKKVYEFDAGVTNACLELPFLDRKHPFEVRLYLTDGSIFFGLASTLRFFPMGAVLTSVDRKVIMPQKDLPCNGSVYANDPEKTLAEVQFQFPCSESDKKNLKAAICIVKNQSVLFQGAVQTVTAEGDMYSLSAEIPAKEIQPAYLEQACVSVDIVYGKACSIVREGISCLPLQAPVLSVSEYTSQHTVVSVDYAVCAPLCGFQDMQGQTVYGSRIVKDNNSSEAICVRPVFRQSGKTCLGVASNAVPVYCEAFFCETKEGKTVVYYRENSGTEGVARCQLQQELFTAHLTEEVAADGHVIAIKPDGAADGGYTLEVHTDCALTLEILNGFYKKLYQIRQQEQANQITPAGFYLLSDALWRMCRYDMQKVHLLSRQFCPDLRSCRVLPGDSLLVETELYTSQIDPQTEDITGYTLTNTQEYKIAFQESGGYLMFHPFVDTMLQGMSRAGGADVRPQWLQAGVLDLSQNIRYPFLEVIYPANYYASDLPLSYEPSENILLLGADTYDTLQEKAAAIVKNPQSLNESQENIAFFRGRSTLMIQIPVFVDGQMYRVPVGTTVRMLFQQLGIPASQQYRLFRLNAKQQYRPVFFDCPDTGDAFLLTGSDRMVLQNQCAAYV